MLAELSSTSTIRRAVRMSHENNGSARAATISPSKASCTSSEMRCRNRCQSDRGRFSSNICRQKMTVDTGTRLSRIFST